ncbi:hypothetical protein [Streptomyces sp. NPDC014006]|uniref:hypothetical protein n=1 Tax=Streptomyces sp. NPDC014006 TaxID=3364870 RepID=UPI003701135F
MATQQSPTATPPQPLRAAASALRRVPGAGLVGRAAGGALDRIGAVSPRGRRLAVYTGAGVLGVTGVVEWPVALTGAAVAWLTQPWSGEQQGAAATSGAPRPEAAGRAAPKADDADKADGADEADGTSVHATGGMSAPATGSQPGQVPGGAGHAAGGGATYATGGTPAPEGAAASPRHAPPESSGPPRTGPPGPGPTASRHEAAVAKSAAKQVAKNAALSASRASTAHHSGTRARRTTASPTRTRTGTSTQDVRPRHGEE